MEPLLSRSLARCVLCNYLTGQARKRNGKKCSRTWNISMLYQSQKSIQSSLCGKRQNILYFYIVVVTLFGQWNSLSFENANQELQVILPILLNGFDFMYMVNSNWVLVDLKVLKDWKWHRRQNVSIHWSKTFPSLSPRLKLNGNLSNIARKLFNPFTATGYFDIPPLRWPTFLAMLFHILKEGMGLSLLDELEVQYHVIKK